MGLLNDAGYVPDQIMGLLNHFRRPSQPAYAPGGPPSANEQWLTQQADQAPSQAPMAGRLSALLRDSGTSLQGGHSDFQGALASQQQANQLRQAIAQTVTDPRERAVAMANPVEWAKQNATRYGYHGVNGGDEAIFGDPTAGGQVHTAPKYGVTEGRGYAIGPGGLQGMGELDPSFGQVTARQNADTASSGFTLGPGATRYGPDGQPIAAAPFAPRLEQVDPSKDLYQMGGPQAAPRINAPQALSQLFPKATATSGARTPEHNAAVGGAKNSYHLKGQALDLTPPPGMSMEQFAGAIKASGIPLEEIINEGDHVHVAWADDGGAKPGPQMLKQGSPNSKDAPSGYRYKADGSGLEPIPGGPADPSVSANTKNLRPLPAGVVGGYTGNKQALTNIDRAISAAQTNPDAFGAANYVPGPLRDRSPGKGGNGGVGPRAIVAQIGSQKIHDLSGAAVTASEFPRLRPFIPLATDRADVVIEKLKNMRLEYQNMLDQTEQAYGPESGYRPIQAPPAAPQAAPVVPKAPPTKASGGPAVGTVQKGYRFKGGDPSNPQSWAKVG